LFSTSDAQGPLRRFIVFFNCTDLRAQLAGNPAGATLLGLSNALNDPGLCPNSEGGSVGSGLLGILNPKAKGNKKQAAPTPTNQTPGLPNVTPNLPGRPNLTPPIPAVPLPNVTPPSPPSNGSGSGSGSGSGGSNGGSGGGSPTVPNSDLNHLLPKGGQP